MSAVIEPESPKSVTSRPTVQNPIINHFSTRWASQREAFSVLVPKRLNNDVTYLFKAQQTFEEITSVIVGFEFLLFALSHRTGF